MQQIHNLLSLNFTFVLRYLASAAARIGSLTCFGVAVECVARQCANARLVCIARSAWAVERWNVDVRWQAHICRQTRGYCTSTFEFVHRLLVKQSLFHETKTL
jgi:hypothetical protein